MITKIICLLSGGAISFIAIVLMIKTSQTMSLWLIFMFDAENVFKLFFVVGLIIVEMVGLFLIREGVRNGNQVTE